MGYHLRLFLGAYTAMVMVHTQTQGIANNRSQTSRLTSPPLPLRPPQQIAQRELLCSAHPGAVPYPLEESRGVLHIHCVSGDSGTAAVNLGAVAQVTVVVVAFGGGATEQPQSGGFLDTMRDTLFGGGSSRGSVPNVPPRDSRPVWNSGQAMQQAQVDDW